MVIFQSPFFTGIKKGAVGALVCFTDGSEVMLGILSHQFA